MKLMMIVYLAALLSACSMPTFVGDAPPIPVTSKTPDHFELPARFAFARVVYGATQAAGMRETALWTDLPNQAERLGSFSLLIGGNVHRWSATRANLIETARKQRFNYLLVVRMHPETGSADVALLHVGSGGVMATAQAVSPSGGRRGFWGGRIKNPSRLQRATLKIAQATAPVVEEMLRGAAERQH
ncbi:hypothetical protein [Sulfitobacter sp. SK012]|uniref:hypothetical protein n=1 Tax=Sulfitobacter sp. SK012 TaxID=1389005 RepID=UPI0013B3C592|nr:hypothetical protein [Sulfitobacter sp. SK012]